MIKLVISLDRLGTLLFFFDRVAFRNGGREGKGRKEIHFEGMRDKSVVWLS